jgi:hypothetical protein
MIALADETATTAVMLDANLAGEFRPRRSASTDDMSARVIRHTKVNRVATLPAPASPAVTSPTEPRRR